MASDDLSKGRHTFEDVLESCCYNKPLKQDVVCNGCHAPIKGMVVQALSKAWHPDHFCCTHCKEPITGQKFNIEGGKPYCEHDYSQLFLKRCQGCNLPIRDVVVVALNCNWHFDHFVCATCGTRLAENGFFERENNAFCKMCYEDKFCPKCRECSQPIKDTAVLALGEKWHQNCFRCTKCFKSISDPTFEVYNSKQICEKCVLQLPRNEFMTSETSTGMLKSETLNTINLQSDVNSSG